MLRVRQGYRERDALLFRKRLRRGRDAVRVVSSDDFPVAILLFDDRGEDADARLSRSSVEVLVAVHLPAPANEREIGSDKVHLVFKRGPFGLAEASGEKPCMVELEVAFAAIPSSPDRYPVNVVSNQFRQFAAIVGGPSF